MSDSEPGVRETLLAVMRSNHYLVEYPQHSSHAAHHPSLGSPERACLEAEIARELGEALAPSGLSMLNLVERR